MSKLFLDDYRNPLDCVSYMYKRIHAKNPIYLEEWEIAKNYEEFVYYIINKEMPEIISFDHDLHDSHYSQEFHDMPELYDTCQEKTGYHCLKWLIDYCMENNKKVPECIFHTMNEVGYDNMKSYYENYLKTLI